MRIGLSPACNQRSITPTKPQTVRCTPQGNIELLDLNWLATNVISSWRIANIAPDDGFILPHGANRRGWNLRDCMRLGV
jgi:hypothetical protein